MLQTHVLDMEQIAQLVAGVRAGVPDVQIAHALAVTPNAVGYWKRLARSDADWLRYIVGMEHELVILRRAHALKCRQLELATSTIRDLAKKTGLRVSLAQTMSQSSGLKLSHANEIFGLTPSAGRRVQARPNDNAILTLLRVHVASNPDHGIARIWEAAFKGLTYPYNQVINVYRENGMQMAGRKARPWKPDTQHVPKKKPLPDSPDEMWSADWMMTLVQGKRLWVLQIMDEFTRECLVCTASRHATAAILVSSLTKAQIEGRKPASLRCDNGRQFRSKLFRGWAWRESVAIRHTRYRTPQDNVFVERLHQTLQTELISNFTFRTLDELQEGLDFWRKRYNSQRPHRSLGMRTPEAFCALYRR